MLIEQTQRDELAKMAQEVLKVVESAETDTLMEFAAIKLNDFIIKSRDLATKVDALVAQGWQGGKVTLKDEPVKDKVSESVKKAMLAELAYDLGKMSTRLDIVLPQPTEAERLQELIALLRTHHVGQEAADQAEFVLYMLLKAREGLNKFRSLLPHTCKEPPLT